MTDLDLLHQYASSRSEAAFSELVARYTNLVYSICVRSLSDRHLAEEATQAVFLILAKKADTLAGEVILSGWFFRTARLVCANAYRLRQRRQKYESEAGKMYDQHQSAPEHNEWAELSPVLDKALSSLGDEDRNAILLRYFENKNYAEIGAQLNLSEDAVRKRTTRALEKLKKVLSRKGLSLSVVALGALLPTWSAQAATPAGLAEEIVGLATLSGSGALKTAASEVLAETVLSQMKWGSIKLISSIFAVLLISGAFIAGSRFSIVHPISLGAAIKVTSIPVDLKENSPTLLQTIETQKPTPQTKSDYLLQDLGTLGGKTSIAHGLNSAGYVVGESDTSKGNAHAFLWKEGEMLDLTPDLRDSCAYAVNDRGQVVGEMLLDNGDTHAFLWDNGIVRDLGTLGGSQSIACSINNLGQVVGAARTRSGILHAFLWEQDQMTDLTPSSLESCANDINDVSEIVGSVMDQVGTTFGFHLKDKKLQTATLPSKTYAVSSVGKYVGITLEPKKVKSFICQNGSMFELAPHYFKVTANDINESDEVVGTIADERDVVHLSETNEDWEKGFIFWWKGGQLKALVTSGEYRLYGAGGINNRGQIIGRGAFKDKHEIAHAILLTPQSE
jgi:RNA polymerase sigma factor (sigma-70 family)